MERRKLPGKEQQDRQQLERAAQEKQQESNQATRQEGQPEQQQRAGSPERQRERQREGQQEKPQEKSMMQEILSWVGCFAVAIAIAFFIVTFIGQRVRVDGRSMEDTLHNNDNLICDKISYRFHDPERFDIVILHPTSEKKDRWIKRIIGLPGEEVYIDGEGRIYINGEVLEESYGKETIQSAGLARVPIRLGEDEYWVMGDNRNHSSDSREIGPVPRSQIIGRAFVRIYPFNKMGFIQHQ